jgi:hypothetical protein
MLRTSSQGVGSTVVEIEIEPVRIFEEEDKWHADYGPGLSQTFETREAAWQTASAVAAREGRDVEEVPGDVARALMRKAAARHLDARREAREAAAREQAEATSAISS